jgi:hypothetical protein
MVAATLGSLWSGADFPLARGNTRALLFRRYGFRRWSQFSDLSQLSQYLSDP